ncbi:Probable poly(glycerol-phosphate) alpha-glucosyltransferase [Serratia entomophila]|uniref:glycosyltransferase n=1 Tax=Serratia entomophila TaxID=42906 RepID=UPI00217A5C4A|nr:glycosyltransferase [Serratia entomophila]CAI0883604.1 Probable poly(glycerol-phosphate) alpha-glucosyltransferase [Serratia entomophila]CAI1769997.1 Probable poly(glycerol-phosphate) alpha-glucosyltransferase [Serratia entomophila]
MKIERVMNIFPVLDAGGTEDVILKTSNYLISEKNARVAILADCSDGQRKQDFLDLGIELFNNPYAKNKKKLFGNIKSLKNAIKEFRPEIIHTHSLYSLGIAYVNRIINGGNYKITHTGHGGPKSNYDDISKRLAFMADKYITLSNQSFLKISDSGKNKKICLIYNGTSAPEQSEIFTPSAAEPDEKLRLGFIGRLTKQKGLPTLIQALGTLHKQGIDFEMNIIGDGEDRAALENETESLGIKGKVKFHGYSNRPWSLVKDIPIIVIPSLWEQGALVAIEAIIRNHTIVATDINGLNDVVVDKETGYLFDKLDSEALAGILEDLSAHRKEFIYIDENVRNKFLFPERTGAKIHQVYEEILR